MVFKLFSRAAPDDKVSVDLEDQKPTTVESENMAEHDQDVLRKLEVLETKLGTLLNAHVQEIKSLRLSTVNGVGNLADKKASGGTATTMDLDEKAGSRLHTHVKYLDDFFDAYVQNVRALQGRLNSKFPDGQGRTAENIGIEEKTYDALMQQFNMQLIISTFSAGLIVTFCAFAQTVLIEGSHAKRLYNVGLLLSLFAITFHMFNIIISGRGAALCSDHTLVKEHTIAYFYRALATCEQLYLHGTLLFVVAVFEMSFVMFDSVVYPAVFCGVTAVGGVALVTGKFRKVSVLYQNVARVKALVWTLSGRVRR